MPSPEQVPIFQISIPPSIQEIDTCQSLISFYEQQRDAHRLTMISSTLSLAAKLCSELIPPCRNEASKLRDLSALALRAAKHSKLLLLITG